MALIGATGLSARRSVFSGVGRGATLIMPEATDKTASVSSGLNWPNVIGKNKNRPLAALPPSVIKTDGFCLNCGCPHFSQVRRQGATGKIDRGVCLRTFGPKTPFLETRFSMRSTVKDGKPMNDGNILRRFIKPAADALKLKKVN